ncbi:MAG TPA: diguanylate cyclase [Steroidobacteraceae bacterium]|nr:diguanylate cyclase [Steroidobacteraceae bacterium]
MAGWFRATLACVLACLAAPLAAAAGDVEVQALDPSLADPVPADVLSGSLDDRFGPMSYRDLRRRGGPFWLRLSAPTRATPADVSTLVAHKGRHLQIEVFVRRNGAASALPRATRIPNFSGMHDVLFVMPADLTVSEPLYARVEPVGRGAEALRFSTTVLDDALSAAAEHQRMIAFAFGALMAVAVAALLIWFVLKDKMFVFYALLFSMQALYMAYQSGQGFEWPFLSFALPLGSHAWNVPAALSGAAACLFVREITDVKRFSPLIYRIFGWFAVAFTVLALANIADLIGLGGIVAMIGNLIFVSAAAFTLVAAFMAWRRGSRAAGWFLIAWGLLETFTIATAIGLLLREAEDITGLLYYGLPLSMVGAAVFIALGVADRLREQRAALTEAQRRAQTDPLTGVLNRRSIVERLEAACARAQARGLPISILFIDLDHFKQINDTYGHAAGDACLRAIIDPIHAELRQSDVIGRYGGEEFVVILSSADSTAAHPIAQRILERVAEVSVEGFGTPIRLTCSIGVAASDTLGVWGDRLIAQADAAVYAAKRSGRNRVQVASALAA